MKAKIKDYLGENIYIGFDVHKKSWQVSIMIAYSTHKKFFTTTFSIKINI